jgi:NAD(P)-dependent dehydrogenase (short-subunit alcohol dehydrogenase family)
MNKAWSITCTSGSYAFRPYEPLTACAQSKTADVLLAVEADRGWWEEGIRANALNPGAIATHRQPQDATGAAQDPQQGAATSALLAASPLLDRVGGRYFDDCAEAPAVTARPADLRGWPGTR